MIIDKCKNCNKEFSHKNGGYFKFCSIDCRNFYQEKRNRINNCLVCNKSIKSNNISKRRKGYKFCNKTCRTNYYNGTPIEYICTKCDNKFLSRNKKRKYCSYKCKDSIVKKNYNKQAREKIINLYGGKCQCCNENKYRFLTIDHINGGGCQHRKVANQAAIYRDVLNNMQNYRILCMNCNWAIGKYNICPHKESVKV